MSRGLVLEKFREIYKVFGLSCRKRCDFAKKHIITFILAPTLSQIKEIAKSKPLENFFMGGF